MRSGARKPSRLGLTPISNMARNCTVQSLVVTGYAYDKFFKAASIHVVTLRTRTMPSFGYARF